MSHALSTWKTGSSEQLDALMVAHTSVDGVARGRRYATMQINAALVVQLGAHFQLFCRDLHSDAADVLVMSVAPGYESMLRLALTTRRSLDRGNAVPRAIAADFARLDLDIWAAAEAYSARTTTRRAKLEQLAAWRNAIAHQDFAFSRAQQTLLSGTQPTLAWVRRWRSACDGLAETFDAVVRDHVRGRVAGVKP